jgi:hypothetical protein
MEVCGLRPAGYLCIRVLENRKFSSTIAVLLSVCETHTVSMVRSCGGVKDDTHAASKARQHLGPNRNDQVNLMGDGHFFSFELTRSGHAKLTLFLRPVSPALSIGRYNATRSSPRDLRRITMTTP